MAPPALSKIDHPPATLRDLVQDRMRAAIIEGVFAPGERLVERPLCEQLGVSRTVVRETIRYLEAEGLVQILPGQGPIVARLSPAEATQIYDIRRMLEAAAAKACAERMTPDRAERLTAALEALKAAFADKAPGSGTIHDATTRLYSVIFEGAGHDIAWGIVQRLNGRISRLRMMTLSVRARQTSGQAHMERICAALISGDGKAAEAAVLTHIAEAKALAEEILRDGAARE